VALGLLVAQAIALRAQAAPKRLVFIKTAMSGLLLSVVVLAWRGYAQFNRGTSEQLSALTQIYMQRSIRVGRLRRISLPPSLVFAKTSLLDPGAAMANTAPDVSSSSVALGVSQVLPAILKRAPLAVNITLHQPNLHVRQVVGKCPLGKPIAKWDAGLPANDITQVSDHGNGSSPANTSPQIKRLPKHFPVTLGRVTVKKGEVLLEPAELPIYGQGPELIEIRNVSAELAVSNALTTSNSSARDYNAPMVEGIAIASLKGYPRGGGDLHVDAKCELAALQRLQPGDKIVDVNVRGSGIRASQIAAFLNLPFRAEEGKCNGDVALQFTHLPDSQVPEMHGMAMLEGVSLRFHPDPKTPEVSKISGGLRFDDKTIFMDGPNGELGSLPMTVVGSIDLLGEYNLLGYVRNVDVNNVIDTFDVDKFVPVEGQVRGEARMTGLLEEPIVEGWVTSVGPGMFDKLPVDRAKVEFEWEAQAGLLSFKEIRADIVGGGEVSGNGGLYFDMTKITPFDMSRPVHHQNSPKAAFWNPDSPHSGELSPPPTDEFELDLNAPSRPYDSMLFTFQARNIPGSNLLQYYGGENGLIAKKSVGLVHGDAVLAGHAKDANCRAFWNTVSKPPTVRLSSQRVTDGDHDAGRIAMQNVEMDESESGQGTEIFHRESNVLFNEIKDLIRGDVPLGVVQDTSAATPMLYPGSDALGGGEFQGVVFLKLGDLPSARRIKMRTTIRNFDVRRVAWGKTGMKQYLASSPTLEASIDSYFRGVLHQQAMPNDKHPRTPHNMLLGAEGALAIKDLRLNKMGFSKTLTGSFECGAGGLNVKLSQREPLAPLNSPRSGQRNTSRPRKMRDETIGSSSGSHTSRQPGNREDSGGPSLLVPGDEICLSSSRNSSFALSARRNRTELMASFENLSGNTAFLKLFARELDLDEILGGNGKATNGIPTGIIGTDFNLNLGEWRGDGVFSVQRGRYRNVFLDSFLGNLTWSNQYIHLQKSSARIRRSQYGLEGWYRFPVAVSTVGHAWELKLTVPKVDIREITSAIVAQRHRSARHFDDFSRYYSTDYGDVQSSDLARGHSSDGDLSSSLGRPVEFEDTWSMPDLPFDEMMAWFNAYKRAANDRSKREDMILTKKAHVNPLPGLLDLRGILRGSITMRYDSETVILSEEDSSVADQKGRLLRAILEPLEKFSFEFDIRGDGWEVGPHSLGDVSACGDFSNNKLQIYPLQVSGPDGFELSAAGTISGSGEIGGYVYVKNASSAVLNQYSRGNFRLDGKCSARLDVSGLIADPQLDGKAVWTEATLNDKRVRDALGDVCCRNGRCTLNLNARFGGRERPDRVEDFDVYRSLNTDDADAIDDASSQVEENTSGSGQRGRDLAEIDQEIRRRRPVNAHDRRLGEPLKVFVSAPLRFYAVEYLRKSVPRRVWAELEPLLATAKNPQEDWIAMDVDVRRYGLLLINTAFPSLGWVDGSCNIDLRVRGTLQEPVIVGNANVHDGQLWPSILPSPIEGIKGEVLFDAAGAVTVRSFYGRCNGRTINIVGSLPLSEKHRQATEAIASQQVSKASKGKLTRAEKRSFAEKRSSAASTLSLYSRGISLEAGEVVLDLKDQFTGRISGRVAMKGSLMAPTMAGFVALSRGVMYLARPPVSPDSALKSFASKRFAGNAEYQGDNLLSPSMKAKKIRPLTPLVPPVSSEGEKKPRTRANSLKLDNFRVSLGKDFEIVYPYLVTFGASGSVTLDGSTANPVPSGKISFPRGQLNLLTSRMELKRDVENYARFEKGGDPFAALDPILNLSLEDRDVVLQVKEVRASNWAQQLSIVDKRGEQIDESAWIGLVRSRLEELQKGIAAGVGLPSLAARYLFNLYSVRGKLGSLQWRLYPALVNSMGKFSSAKLQDDIGIGAEFDYGKISLAMRASLTGSKGGSLTFRPTDRIKLELESDGVFKSNIEIRISPNRGNRRGQPGPVEERFVIESPASSEEKRKEEPISQPLQ
jgi:TamB, inner membrane protein subunit of TAM complex